MSGEKNLSGRQNVIRNAAQRAVNATFHFGITAVCSDLKKRSHRATTVQKVLDSFQDWVTRGDFVEYASSLTSDLMRHAESQFGKPSKEWSYDELLQAYEDVEWYFLKLSELYGRPKGRPPKIRIQGIVSKVQRDGATKRRKLTREKLKSLEKPFLSYAEGALARKEKEQYLKEGFSVEYINHKFGTLEAWRRYKKEVIDTPRRKLPSGTIDRFLKQKGIDPKNKAAFKMQISRARRPT